MNESEWLANTDPADMLWWLTHPASEREHLCLKAPSDRQLRLFACAVTRLAGAVRGRPFDPVSLEAIAAAEKYADGLASGDDLAEARIASDLFCCHRDAPSAAAMACRMIASQQPQVAALLRDIVGNPFRPTRLPRESQKCSCSMYGRDGWVVGSKGKWEKCNRCNGTGRLSESCPWLLWNHGTIPALARTIYDSRDFDRMPLLADALEDARCDNENILRHCRGQQRRVCQRCGGDGKTHGTDRPFEWSPDVDYRKCVVCKGSGVNDDWGSIGPHVKGCWVIDLLLGKE